MLLTTGVRRRVGVCWCASQGLYGVFERFRGILHEGDIDKRVQYTIEGLFAVYRTKFKENPAIHPDLDLVESEDQFTHDIGLDDELDKVPVCLRRGRCGCAVPTPLPPPTLHSSSSPCRCLHGRRLAFAVPLAVDPADEHPC